MNSPIILTLNLQDDSILLNEGVLNALDWPRQVQLLMKALHSGLSSSRNPLAAKDIVPWIFWLSCNNFLLH